MQISLYYKGFSWYTAYIIMAIKDHKTEPKSRRESKEKRDLSPVSTSSLSPRTKRIMLSLFLLILTLIIILGAFDAAGVVGHFLYVTVLKSLFGFGIVLVPVFLVVYAVNLLKNTPHQWSALEYISSTILTISTLGFIHIVSPDIKGGGLIGYGIGTAMTKLLDVYAGAIVLAALALVSILILVNEELRIPDLVKNLFSKKEVSTDDITMGDTMLFTAEELAEAAQEPVTPTAEEPVREEPIKETKKRPVEEELIMNEPALLSETYEYPPIDLLGKSSGKPSVGDIKANANLIKRTLLNFGIDVEMDEVATGPTMTRYALKPAEGIKLARITALKSDLELALAAHPIRIEAPIPGKSLVGIEIPNRTSATVGLGSLIEEDQFQNSPHRLFVALGKGVTGKSYFANLAKMPHLLIAGTTGSGKSVTVHNIILSLLYRNGPEDLRFIMVDPKRVELTLYNDIPHLLTPVIKEPKKAILALKWAAKEMERRYDLLEKEGCRDIQSYHKNVLEPALAKAERKGSSDGLPERMPYIVTIIDELADIMQAYPRELEAGIVRLAQMSRAVGIHLILSTQRPSVNVITGLIKANIPSRLALKVASQIDSRTILDAPGAESLLGKGDMLYQGEGMSKPERMQCGNVDEGQINAVVSFIKKHNVGLPDEITLGETLDDDRSIVSASFDGDDEDDELYEDARAVVIEAGKASTSYIQRKLKVGYSRAARLIDLLEERGVVGPADGAKPREVISQGSGMGLSTGAEPDGFDSENEV
jgi:S-DNA-T family DNA segregation ATPase FtsK/SpoIIIE